MPWPSAWPTNCNDRVGGAVGYQVRFTEQVGEQAYLKFMTDGILLSEIQSDPWLSKYDTLIIDEAHERSLNIDFLLGFLKKLIRKRKDLKLIITSATIDTARFAGHFDDAPVLSVEGRSYPVEVRYRDFQADAAPETHAGRKAPVERADDLSMADKIVRTVDEISLSDGLGDILVFLPGEREIREVHLALAKRKYRADRRAAAVRPPVGERPGPRVQSGYRSAASCWPPMSPKRP